VDNVLDTGLTLSEVRKRVLQSGALSAEICVLLRKSGAQIRPVAARWIGFEIGNEFVIGYGLDLDGKFRGLKDILVLET
jgi:hypoxanthine phosphoribosyltransferase